MASERQQPAKRTVPGGDDQIAGSNEGKVLRPNRVSTGFQRFCKVVGMIVVVLAGSVALLVVISVILTIGSKNRAAKSDVPFSAQDLTESKTEKQTVTRSPSSEGRSLLDVFTNTQVYVACVGALQGMACSVERRAGSDDITASWDVEFVCANGAKVRGSTSHPVQPRVGSISTKIIQWSEFLNMSACDTVTSSTVSNIVLRRN